jgi:hypothetical protein
MGHIFVMLTLNFSLSFDLHRRACDTPEAKMNGRPSMCAEDEIRTSGIG